jgi:NAD(P)-dependent dehydrogenase (short-subunit alcohol dehydrogenase family)
MSDYRFDGRAAVVTGAGRGIGRAYALLLGERGASVVVNDLGGRPEGGGADEGPATEVADEIVAAGGNAIADTSDISTEAGAQAAIAAAVEQFGRVDIVVNNAGNFKPAGFGAADLENLTRHINVHLIGSFLTSLAAWPHMVEQQYGRIVNTASAGIFGLPDNLAYAAVKAGIIGMSRQMKIAGEPHNIKTNVIAPAAYTRLAGDSSVTERNAQNDRPEMSTTLVAPIVAYLAHEDCPVSGEVYQGGAGRFARFFIAGTNGYVHTGSHPTIEDVAAHWDEINDETGYYVPSTLWDWSTHYLKHMERR